MKKLFKTIFPIIALMSLVLYYEFNVFDLASNICSLPSQEVEQVDAMTDQTQAPDDGSGIEDNSEYISISDYVDKSLPPEFYKNQNNIIYERNGLTTYESFVSLGTRNVYHYFKVTSAVYEQSDFIQHVISSDEDIPDGYLKISEDHYFRVNNGKVTDVKKIPSNIFVFDSDGVHRGRYQIPKGMNVYEFDFIIENFILNK